MTSSILIAGDRADIARALGDYLRSEGFDVVVTTAPADALEAASAVHPDLAVIDLDLPIDGAVEIGRALRVQADWSRLPLVVVRREGSDGSDKVVALEQGADEVLVEPYELRELLARLRALARRGAAPRRLMSVGELELDANDHRVSVSGREIQLTSKEFELLRYFLEAGGRVVGREEVLENVWSYRGAAEVESRTLDVHIRSLRKKLRPEHGRIVTVRGVGYRFDISDEGR
jgi:DNA-binding response OmpR family regulator